MGLPQHNFVPMEEAKSPMITTEGILATMVIDANEDGKVETFNVTWAYLQE